MFQNILACVRSWNASRLHGGKHSGALRGMILLPSVHQETRLTLFMFLSVLPREAQHLLGIRSRDCCTDLIFTLFWSSSSNHRPSGIGFLRETVRKLNQNVILACLWNQSGAGLRNTRSDPTEPPQNTQSVKDPQRPASQKHVRSCAGVTLDTKVLIRNVPSVTSLVITHLKHLKQSKIINLSSFSHIILNLFDLLSSADHRKLYSEERWEPNITEPHWRASMTETCLSVSSVVFQRGETPVWVDNTQNDECYLS